MTPALFALASFIPPFTADPAPTLLRSKQKSRNLVCERVSADTGRQRRPGLIPRSKPRGDFVNRTVMICTARPLRPGLRDARDEALLDGLDAFSREVAESALARRPDLADRTWLVEAYVPSAPLIPKIAFATKNALMSSGASVSDRVPMLGTGDVGVLTRLSPDEAYPAACLRYSQSGAMREDDVLLGLLTRDRRETTLHAGLCEAGRWTWLR